MTGIPKVLLGLALGLPMGAYAVGSIVSSAADDPARRAPIILEDPRTPDQETVPGATLRPSPTPTPPPPPSNSDDDDLGDGREDDREDEEVRNRPEVVVPSFVDRGDDDDDDRDDRDDDTDDDDGDDD